MSLFTISSYFPPEAGANVPKMTVGDFVVWVCYNVQVDLWEELGVQIWVYRRVLHMYFSFRGERKVPKESPLKGVTHGASLKKPTT